MREFGADYLRRTRKGMWDDSRSALEPLALASRRLILDVGCGTGELSRVLAAECPGTVVGCDADGTLLASAREYVPVVAGDATRLPFESNAVDLVVCQALLINLPDPSAAVTEFARVSSDLVAAVEPDNGSVSVESSVPTEGALEQRAREAYLEGVSTDVALGASAAETFDAAGIDVVGRRRYEHQLTVEPPYDEDALQAARRKASGDGLADDRVELLASDLCEEGYDDLRADWREMGRAVIEQMRERTYRRTETVPFHVTVGRVPDTD